MDRKDQLTLLGGVGLGAGLMYLLDPSGGGQRRALVRNKSVDMGNRTRGFLRPRHLSKGTLGVLGLGAVAGAVSLLVRGLAEENDFTRPLRESRWGREPAPPRWPTATSPTA